MSAGRTAAIACLALFLATTAGCIRPHKAPVAQGNMLKQSDIEQLKTGMTPQQVEYLIGRPILAQPFDDTRWDYVYYTRIGYREPVQKELTLHFEDGRLARIEGDFEGADADITQDLVEEQELPGAAAGG